MTRFARLSPARTCTIINPFSWRVGMKHGLVTTERDLAALAFALDARSIAGWSPSEQHLVAGSPMVPLTMTDPIRKLICSGQDPLGDLFCALRSPERRRPSGATYTPQPIVRAMVRWAQNMPVPGRIVDPGAGSARFLMHAGCRFPGATLIGIESDPLAALIARANLAACGFAPRSRIEVADYREFRLPTPVGRTLFIGNPPYVRHHLIEQRWKAWLTQSAAARGRSASQLAGLHVHFFLATLQLSHPGDFGAFVTAAEWLDVNYGKLVRDMLLNGLGGRTVTLIEPTAAPFPDAATTGVVTCFEIGTRLPSLRLKRVELLDELEPLDSGRLVRRERLESATRWTPLMRISRKTPEGYVELGELCRVHRGQVTGANRVWIAGPHSAGLPGCVLFPTVTKARELFRAGDVLTDSERLRRVIDLPVDLDALDATARQTVERFLKIARSMGGADGYIAQHRKAWWSVGLREAAPILCTYMARRPPAFVRNPAAARHINIAHGIYPRDPLSETALTALARHLARSTCVSQGRTYAGGLTKFEPREIERLIVPAPEMLQQMQG